MDLFFSTDGFTVFSLHILVFGILFHFFNAYCSYVIRKRLTSVSKRWSEKKKCNCGAFLSMIIFKI